MILWSSTIFSQDSLVLESNIAEKNQLKFQEHFFEALTQKAIKNYQKAIQELEECNGIFPNEKAVLFEFSKNYLNLKKTPEALIYINEALNKEPDNIWLLEHLVAIHKKDRNYTEAIFIQEKIAKDYPMKKQQIVYLHLKNKDETAAKEVLAELAEAKLLNSRLRRIRENLTKPKTVVKADANTIIKGSLKEEFEKNKSYSTLKKLLEKLDKENNTELTTYSDKGMNLFPAQPYVYFMHGKALNKEKKHKKALSSLQNGIDFVIDDIPMEKKFYAEILNAYKGLGDTKNITIYQNKL